MEQTKKDQHVIWYDVNKMLPAINRKVMVKRDKDIGVSHIRSFSKGSIHDTYAIYPDWITNSGIYNPTHWADILDQ